jgi:hypothetical protein
VLAPKFLQERLGLLEIGRIKALGEPAIDRGQQRRGFRPLALLLPQAREAHGSAEFEGLGLLVARKSPTWRDYPSRRLVIARVEPLCGSDKRRVPRTLTPPTQPPVIDTLRLKV